MGYLLRFLGYHVVHACEPEQHHEQGDEKKITVTDDEVQEYIAKETGEERLMNFFLTFDYKEPVFGLSRGILDTGFYTAYSAILSIIVPVNETVRKKTMGKRVMHRFVRSGKIGGIFGTIWFSYYVMATYYNDNSGFYLVPGGAIFGAVLSRRLDLIKIMTNTFAFGFVSLAFGSFHQYSLRKSGKLEEQEHFQEVKDLLQGLKEEKLENS